LWLSGSDKEHEDGHHYGGTYQRVFRPWKYRRLRLLEIGVAGGCSLIAWRCYFPFARIVGCDIVDRERSGGGLHIHIADQSSAADLARINSEEGPFDIVIDDGSHINRHQIFSFEQLFPLLAPGGIYVIEDTQTSYWPDFGGASVDQQSRDTAMGYFTELARYLNYPELRGGEMGDHDMLARAKSVSSIYFEHNLMILRKRR
jgi:8-demethyl-8-alpha-L-rhamnosyltetracenomycin-C 2'-O-methyltransferase